MMLNLLSKHFSNLSMNLLVKLFIINKRESNIWTIWTFKSCINRNTFNSINIMIEYSKITNFKKFNNKQCSKAPLLQVTMITPTECQQKIVFKEWLMRRNIKTEDFNVGKEN